MPNLHTLYHPPRPTLGRGHSPHRFIALLLCVFCVKENMEHGENAMAMCLPCLSCLEVGR